MPWLIKTEPDCYSIDDFAREKKTRWTGVRNYQARNFMRDSMKVGDPILFYHSSSEPPGVAGLARVSAAADWDRTALDPKDQHFDAKATKENPIWMAVEVAFVQKFATFVELGTLRTTKGLEKMALLQRGQRLSIQPVTEAEFAAIVKLGEGKGR
ncbi:MAG: EVE domain-containing protein [Phycisphaerae bacterium]|nr:EVE domain-containing protein [Phycisphaerae bacterium]